MLGVRDRIHGLYDGAIDYMHRLPDSKADEYRLGSDVNTAYFEDCRYD
jgi:hypothetical protein